MREKRKKEEIWAPQAPGGGNWAPKALGGGNRAPKAPGRRKLVKCVVVTSVEVVK